MGLGEKNQTVKILKYGDYDIYICKSSKFHNKINNIYELYVSKMHSELDYQKQIRSNS